MVTLATVRAHLRIEHPDEDDLLQAYLDAAHGHLEAIGVDMTVDPLPASVAAAVLLLTGHLYENREATFVGTGIVPVPFGVEMLVAPFRESIA